MSRSHLLCAVLATVPLAFACEKTGADTQLQSNQAQEKAAKDTSQAVNEANGKIATAQAEAQKSLAAAQADFAQTREDYRHKMQSNLDALNKNLDDLDSKEKTATGKEKADLDAALPVLRAQRDAFASDFRSLLRADVATWDSARARVDKEWTDLKSAADKVS